MATGKLVAALVGAVVVLYGMEINEPGSSTPVVQAGRDAGGNVVAGLGGVASDTLHVVGPLTSDALQTVRDSGVGNVLNAPATDPSTGLPPAQQPSATGE